MHILFTRPIEDSEELIIRFKNLGHIVSHMPVIKIKKKSNSYEFKPNLKGIIFTSANAIKFLNSNHINKKIDCFCVGKSTEKKALESGFQKVISAEGNVNNLKELILQNFNSSSGKLLYVSGENISYDLCNDLSKEGYNVDRLINYSSEPVEYLDEKFIDSLRKNMPDIVYIYSQNSAHSFLRLIKTYNLKDSWMNTNLMCISEKTSSVLNELKWKKIFIFSPGEEEFLLYKI